MVLLIMGLTMIVQRLQRVLTKTSKKKRRLMIEKKEGKRRFKTKISITGKFELYSQLIIFRLQFFKSNFQKLNSKNFPISFGI